MMNSELKSWNKRLRAFHADKAKLKVGKRTISEVLVEKILNKIFGNRRNKGRYSKPRLAGSYKTGVKIYKPDEFDYTVSLKLPSSRRVTGSHGVRFQYEEDDIDRHKSSAKRDLDADREIKDAKLHLPLVCYTVVTLKESKAKQFSDAVIEGVLVPYEVLVKFHEFVVKAVDDIDKDYITVKSHAQGPAISLIINKPQIGHKISVDLVPVVNIGKAESILRKYDWPRNQTSEWLSEDEIENIKDTKIFLVPKGDKFWKVSFARCENEILTDIDGYMDGTRKLLLRICKRKLKQWKSKSISGMKSLSSYLLKTLLLWLCEHLPDDDDWYDDQLSARYYNFMSELHYCLKKRYLGEYFLPINNLLETKDKYEIKELLGFVKNELEAMDSMDVGIECIQRIADMRLCD